ncbi:PTS system galactose-specific transporter subunit IIB [Streptococcus pneumoniae]|nr:PTS system galactose-specific transporter subunit IIB [Streptococcus pneumoniae]
MIKILAACGAGVNSSHQIKSALEEELSNRGYDVHCDAVMVKDVNEDLMKGYDIFTPIAATDLGFEPGIPVIEAGLILVLVDGDIVEYGNHQELMDRKGKYYQMQKAAAFSSE